MISDSVKIWRVDLAIPDALGDHLMQCLSSEEGAKAMRFRFARDRLAYVATHAALRRILAHILGCGLDEIRIGKNASGKPCLDPESGFRLAFNLAHSRSLALIAVTQGADVGIDVEQIGLPDSYRAIAARYFGDDVVRQLDVLPQEAKARKFTCLWTRFEALLKWRGSGIFSGDRLPRLTAFDPAFDGAIGAPVDVGPCTLCDLNVGDDHVGAIVVAGATLPAEILDFELTGN